METIVVAYDDTGPARRALRQAATLARALDASLVVATVVQLDEAHALVEEPEAPPEAGAILARARALLEQDGVAAVYQSAIGDPADSIVEVAERNGADLIVVGTRDPGPIQRMFGYSVSQGVLRRARCNVLVVRR
jgi:nucleotide-binding universal stress UspA family protein